jgi:A/G-specific adenine glycosylase
MLQQTQVATVIPYYERFLASFPTIETLAQATEAVVLRHWEGLGYYRRARQLHKAAQLLMSEHEGRFPQRLEEIQQLPGIGRYTAGAIVSFAFDRRAPIVEANTLRVYCRLLGFRGDPRNGRGQQLLWQAAESWLPRRGPGEFNQALMELGSTVCKLHAPDCDRCPMKLLCPTRALGLQDVIPAPAKRQQFSAIREAALVVRRQGRLLLVRCGEQQRWAGLWDFPRFSLSARSGVHVRRELREKLLMATGVDATVGEKIATFKHGVTRYRITLACFEAEPVSGPLRSKRRDQPNASTNGATLPSASESRWVLPNDLEQYALPVTGRKLARMVS